MTMTKIKAWILGVLVVSSAAILVWIQHQEQSRSSQENLALRQQIQELSAENERLSNQVAQASSAPVAAPEQERELLRLRGEVGNLRRRVAEAAKAQAIAPSPPQTGPTTPPAEDEGKLAGIAKMNYTKGWLLAFMLYSQKNGDQFPANFEQAAPYMPQEAKTEALQAGADKYGLGTDQFEIVYQGSTKSVASPQNIMVIREKQPWQQGDGSWARTYGFADGHCEVHRAADGNFGAWEAQRMGGTQTGVPGQ